MLNIQIERSVLARTFPTVCFVFIEAQSESDVYFMNTIVHRLERHSRPLLCGPRDHIQARLLQRGRERQPVCKWKRLPLGLHDHPFHPFMVRKTNFESCRSLFTALSQQVVMMLRRWNWRLKKGPRNLCCTAAGRDSLLCASTIITTLKAKRGQPDSAHTVVIDRIRDRLLFSSSLWVFATDPGPVQAVSCLFLANNKLINALFVCLDAAKSFEAQTKIFLQIFLEYILGWVKS